MRPLLRTLRRVPQRGEAGALGTCPLCAGARAPCLACREEMRARLDEMRLADYVERARN